MPFTLLYLVGICAFVMLLGRMRSKTKPNSIIDRRESLANGTASFMAFFGMELVPLIYIFTPRLDFANYALPLSARMAGSLLLLLAILLMATGQATLGLNWSATLEVREEQQLVTKGIYRYIRHPIYASQWLWGIAQLLMLPNWVAGPLGLLCFLPVYLVRIPREEQMMLEHFGEAYETYMQRTGRVLPRLR